MIVVKQQIALVGHVGDDNIRPPVIIVIAEICTHPRKRFSVFVVAHSRRERNICKAPVVVVAIQKTLHGIVGGVNIHPAVAIKIGEGYS